MLKVGCTSCLSHHESALKLGGCGVECRGPQPKCERTADIHRDGLHLPESGYDDSIRRMCE